MLCGRLPNTPFVNSDRKPEPSYHPALAAFDIKVDRKLKFPVLPLAIATVCRTIANARLHSELIKGVILRKSMPQMLLQVLRFEMNHPFSIRWLFPDLVCVALLGPTPPNNQHIDLLAIRPAYTTRSTVCI